MAGSALARFWRVQRTRDGLAFENARGRFEDSGALITAREGNELEIRGMLDLAKVKGWTEIQISGSDDFKRRAMTAALQRGFAISAEGRDAQLLHEVDRAQQSDPDRETQHTNSRDEREARNRDDHGLER